MAQAQYFPFPFKQQGMVFVRQTEGTPSKLKCINKKDKEDTEWYCFKVYEWKHSNSFDI